MKYFIVFFFIYLVAFGIIDLMQKKIITRWQWARKATHILAGMITYFLPIYLDKLYISALGLLFTIILIASRRLSILSLHRVDRKTCGELVYPFAIFILPFICLPDFPRTFQLSVLVLAFSDGLAGIAGKALNFRPFTIYGNIKSLGGSLTFFIVTCILLSLFYGVNLNTLIIILAFASFLTVAEFFLVYGFDNLVLPVITAVIDVYIIRTIFL